MCLGCLELALAEKLDQTQMSEALYGHLKKSPVLGAAILEIWLVSLRVWLCVKLLSFLDLQIDLFLAYPQAWWYGS